MTLRRATAVSMISAKRATALFWGCWSLPIRSVQLLTPAGATVSAVAPAGVSNCTDLIGKDQHPQNSAVARFAEIIETAVARRSVIKRMIDELMRDGVHYGIIPGTERPTL